MANDNLIIKHGITFWKSNDDRNGIRDDNRQGIPGMQSNPVQIE